MSKKITIPKEQIYDICVVKNYSRKEAAKIFGVSETVVARLLREYGLNKKQEIVIDKELLFSYYITQNHTLEETMQYFNISKTCLCGKLKKYGITKPTQNIKRLSNKVCVDKEAIVHYYIEMNLTLQDTAKKLGCSYKVLLRRLKEFDIKKDTQKRYQNVSKSCLENNGVSSPIKSEKVKQKMTKTNEERYGVPYACMREEYHKFKGSNSQINLDFEKKLQKLGIEYQREFNLGNFLYDFKIGNVLVELNPTVTHNSSKAIYHCEPKDKNYHLKKSEVAKSNGFHCIHIFEWDNEDKIIELFLKNKDKLFARQCEVREIDKKVADEFLINNHLQGSTNGNIVNIGLFTKDNNQLVELMTFGKPRYNKNYQWELLRLCSLKNVSVVGGSAKLLDFFQKTYNPKNIISYCNMSKFNGEVYQNLGFDLLRQSKPQKHWCYLGKGKRQHITDNFLRQHGFDQLFQEDYGKGTSNEELMLKNNYVVVYDCGQLTYVKDFD